MNEFEWTRETLFHLGDSNIINLHNEQIQELVDKMTIKQFNTLLKTKRIAELEEQLKASIEYRRKKSCLGRA